MFRIQIALAFVLLVSALVMSIALSVNMQLSPALDEDAEAALRRTALIAEKTRRLDEFALLEKARFVAARGDLNAAMTAEYPGDWEYERHMAVHKLLERDHILFSEFFSPRNKDRRNLELKLLEREPTTHEIFMAIDASGKGVATLGKDLLSWFGDNVARDYPVVLDVMEKGEARTDVWLWSFDATAEQNLHVVAIAPMHAPGHDRPVGVVVLGSAINDGIARASQQLLEGHPSASARDRKRANARSLAPEIAFFHGNKIYGSTFNTVLQQKLSALLFEQFAIHEQPGDKATDAAGEPLLELELDGRPYTALVRTLSGHADAQVRTGFVVLADAEQLRAPLVRAHKNILMFGALILVVGLVALLVLVHSFFKPFVRIEQGIQEIVAGNKDHQFEVEGVHDSAASLAHLLNQMSAYLQNKPMPDDDDETAGWDELIPGTAPAPAAAATPPRVQGVAPGIASNTGVASNTGAATEPRSKTTTLNEESQPHEEDVS